MNLEGLYFLGPQKVKVLGSNSKTKSIIHLKLIHICTHIYIYIYIIVRFRLKPFVLNQFGLFWLHK